MVEIYVLRKFVQNSRVIELYIDFGGTRFMTSLMLTRIFIGAWSII